MTDKLEKDIEGPASQYAVLRGWLVEKMMRAGRRGFPDHYYLRNGVTILIEFKKPGEQPALQQLKRHREIREHGGIVYAVDSLDEAKRILK